MFMHIFAISGLHIALIAGILVSLLRVLQIPRGLCGWMVIPLIWFYTAATGWQSSAIRSTIMMSVIIAGWAIKRPSDLLNSLAAARTAPALAALAGWAHSFSDDEFRHLAGRVARLAAVDCLLFSPVHARQPCSQPGHRSIQQPRLDV